jgi:hypothetical protein
MNIHRPARKEQHGIQIDSRGQDQPVDKSRAQQTSLGEECPGEQAQRAATAPWPPSGPTKSGPDSAGGHPKTNPAGDDKSARSIPIDHLNASNDD